MVTVPTYQQTERLRPAYQQGVDVRATPDAFGAAIGRGMKSVAAGGMQLADSIQQVNDLKATLTAKDNFTAMQREQLELDYGPNGFMTRQGKSAAEGKEAYFASLEELKKKYAPTDPAAARKFNEAATASVTQSMRSGIMHSAQGLKDWHSQAFTSNIELLKDKALAGYDKPDEIRNALYRGFSEIDSIASEAGWDNSVVELKKKEFSSDIHSRVALAIADKPNGARAALDYVKANGGGMSAKAKLEIEKTLRPYAADEEGMSAATDWLSKGRKVSQLPGDIVGEVAGVAGSAGGGPTRAKAFLMSRSANSGRPGDTTNLDDSFSDNLAALIQDAPEHIRAGLGLGSAYRSNERQKELFEDSDKTGRDVAYPAGYVKPDGSIAKGSNHLHGRAVDLTYNGASLGKAPKAVRDWVHQNAGNYGLRFPMWWEPWHIEPTRGVEGGGATVVPARDGVSYRASAPSYGDAIEQANQIKDPLARASFLKHVSQQFELRAKAEKANADEAKTQIWTMMMQNTPLSAVPLELKIAAGREAVSGFMDFEAKAGDVKTDPVAYSKLSEMAAVNPTGFSQLDLTSPEVINSLSREDWKAMSNKKTSILGDERKAREEGTVYQDAYKVAEEMYGAAGIITGNSAAAQAADNRMREVRFRDAMRLETQQFMEINKGKRPGYEDLRTMAAMLTMKAIASEERTNTVAKFFDGDGLDDVWTGKLYEGILAPSEAKIRVEAKYEDIPADWVAAITVVLKEKDKSGVGPSKSQIVAEWIKQTQELVGIGK